MTCLRRFQLTYSTTFRSNSTSQQSTMTQSTSNSKNIDLVAQSAAELQSLLSSKILTSTQLVEACLAQIERHDRQGMNLRAMIAIAPRSKLLETAQRLDAERENNNLRGPFHGLPIIVKVKMEPLLHHQFVADDSSGTFSIPTPIWAYRLLWDLLLCEMRSTASTPWWFEKFVFMGSLIRDLLTLSQLVEQGLIVLGKTNLSVSVLLLIWQWNIHSSLIRNSEQPSEFSSDITLAEHPSIGCLHSQPD